MAGERGDFSAVVYAPADRRSRDDHDTLYRSLGNLPCSLYPQLDLQVSHRECVPFGWVDESGLTIRGLLFPFSAPLLGTSVIHTDWARGEPDTGLSTRWTLLPLLPG
jgi:hypothetical protein